MNLTTKITYRLKEIKEIIDNADSAKKEADTLEERNHYREMINEVRNEQKGIISFKNELNEIINKKDKHGCYLSAEEKMFDIEDLIEEIESVEKQWNSQNQS